MVASFIVTALVSIFIAIAVFGHILVITALLSEPNDAKRAAEPVEPKETQQTASDLSPANR